MLYMYNYAGTPAKTQNQVRRRAHQALRLGRRHRQRLPGRRGQRRDVGLVRLQRPGLLPGPDGQHGLHHRRAAAPEGHLTLENGRTFTVTAPGVSDTNRYIQSATLNGVAYTKNYLTHADLLAGGTLAFVMGPNPSSWGTGAADIPGSMTTRHRRAGASWPTRPPAAHSPSAPRTGRTRASASLVDDTSLTKWLAFANTATLDLPARRPGDRQAVHPDLGRRPARPRPEELDPAGLRRRRPPGRRWTPARNMDFSRPPADPGLRHRQHHRLRRATASRSPPTTAPPRPSSRNGSCWADPRTAGSAPEAVCRGSARPAVRSGQTGRARLSRSPLARAIGRVTAVRTASSVPGCAARTGPG